MVNDWSLSGIWSGATGTAYSVTAAYQSGGGNVNLTGSPDFAPRVRVVGGPGRRLQRRPAAPVQRQRVPGPLVGSDGLESGNGYLTGCFISNLDLAIARTIKLGGSRNVQLRVDVFNAFNQAGIIARQTHDEPDQPERSGDDHQPAVRFGGKRDRRAGAAERRRVRRRDRLPAAAHDAAAGEVQLLGAGPRAKQRGLLFSGVQVPL